MDRIREFVQRETFHTISYVASISWIMLLPLFLTPPVVSKLESTPDYRCNGEDKAPVHDKCFSQFKQHYEETGASVFVTFFGILNFSAITMVFFIYSRCMKRRVRINSQGDGTLLFCAYFGQLASRFVLHIISVVVCILLYLKNDLNFECFIKGSDWVHQRASNFTGEEQMYECFIHRETTGFCLILALIMLNSVFTLVAVAEMIWMFIIQSRGHCINNEEFRRYLNPNFNFANGEVSPLTPASRDVTGSPSPSVTVNYSAPPVPVNPTGLSEPINFPSPSVTVNYSAPPVPVNPTGLSEPINFPSPSVTVNYSAPSVPVNPRGPSEPINFPSPSVTDYSPPSVPVNFKGLSEPMNYPGP